MKLRTKLLCLGAATLTTAALALGIDYESPAVALERARAAGPPGAGAAAGVWADAGWLALFGDNDYARARRYFEEALAREPALPRALEGYGRTLEVLGDYDGALHSYLEFIAAAPGHPAAYAYLYRAHVLEEDTPSRDYFVSSLQRLCARDDVPPALRAKATFFLFDRAHRAGDFAAAEELLGTLRPIRRWRFIGPFDNEGKAGFDAVYAPEGGIDLRGRYEGKVRPVRWRELPAPLPTGFVDLRSVLAPATKGVAYLAVAVNAPAAAAASLAFGAAGAVKVWFNGALIFARDSYHEGYFDQYVAAAPLRAGRNLLLVKICGDEQRWGFGARFLDERGEPLDGLSFSTAAADIAAAAANTGRPAVPAGGDDLGFFDKRIAAGDADAFDYYYAALLHAARADTDEGEEVPTKLMLAAAQAMPSTADFYYYVGTSENEESRERVNLARALALGPQHNQARLGLAEYYYRLERRQAALDVLEEVLAANADFVEAAQYQAKIYWEEGWAYDADRLAAALSARVPTYPYSKMVAALFETNYGDLERAAALWRQIYDADIYAQTARDQLFTLLLNAGDVAAALEVMTRALAADAYDLDARKKIIAALAAYDRYDDALAAVEEALRFRPEDYELWHQKGAALEQLGDDAAARAAYRQAIAYKQNYPALENYLNYLEPAREAAAAPRLDAYELLAAYPGDDAFPRDSAVRLLDDKQVEVFANGTNTRTIHQVIKVLTPEGAEKYRRMYINYTPGSEAVELKRTAIIKPDGTEITATQVKEYNVFDVWSRLYYSYVNKVITMPGLAPGDVIDFEYKISQTGTNIFADYFGDFYSFGGKNSTIRARYVLTLPAAKKYYFRRLRGAPPPKTVRRGDRITYVYNMDKLGPIETEPFMPAMAEILPAVQVSTFASWDEVGEWYRGLIKDVSRPSAEVEKLAAELTAGAPDDLAKVRRIYDFTVSRIRYVGLEFGIGGYRPHSPKQCIETLYGDCKDKATLMNTLYRLAGFRAYPALLRTADLGEMDYGLPILGLFNHMISYVELGDGRTFFLDGTAEYHGYRELPVNDQGVEALVIFDDHTAFIRTPVLGLGDNELTTRTTFTLQANGDAYIHRVVAYGAADSPGQRERLHVPAKRRPIIEEYWNGLYPGTKIYHEKFSDFADLSRPVRIEYDATAPRLFDAASEKVRLDVVVHKSRLLDVYGKKSERRWPLVLRKNNKTVAELTYIIPPGYAAASLPFTKEFRSRFGTYKTEVRTSRGRITITSTLELFAQRITPADYPAFREFCLNVDDWENEPIVLQKTE